MAAVSASASTLWFWSDWLGDQEVRRLTPEERGVWIDMLALAAAAQPYGYVCDGKGRSLTDGEIARVTGASPEAVSKLIAGILDKGAASRDRTGRIYNRRMVRDAELKRTRAASGREGGKATARKYFGKFNEVSGLPKQNAQRPRHTPSLPKDIKPLSSVAAREIASRVDGLKEATDEASKRGPSPKCTRAEFDEHLAKKRPA
jgi:hypothetical protein